MLRQNSFAVGDEKEQFVELHTSKHEDIQDIFVIVLFFAIAFFGFVFSLVFPFILDSTQHNDLMMVKI